MITNLVLGMVGSAIIAIIYGFLVAQKEEQIRHYLSKQTKGLARKIYIKAFVGAVRGKAAVTNIGLLTILIVLIFYAFSVFVWGEARRIEDQVETINSKYQQMASGPSVTENTDKRSEKDKLDAMVKEWNDLRIKASRLVTAMRIISGLVFIVFYMVLLFWRPFVMMRQRFAYETERFALRIQGLASKAELAELAVAEANVIDEKTLRHFVEITRGVANRHGIPQLVTFFDLWKDEGTSA